MAMIDITEANINEVNKIKQTLISSSINKIMKTLLSKSENNRPILALYS